MLRSWWRITSGSQINMNSITGNHYKYDNKRRPCVSQYVETDGCWQSTTQEEHYNYRPKQQNKYMKHSSKHLSRSCFQRVAALSDNSLSSSHAEIPCCWLSASASQIVRRTKYPPHHNGWGWYGSGPVWHYAAVFLAAGGTVSEWCETSDGQIVRAHSHMAG
jgi:hypothetical protein